MPSCILGSPDLVTSLSGTAAAPTFAFDAANSNYFGLAGSFTSSNGTICSFPTRSVAGAGGTSTYVVTPIIVTTSGNTAKTTICAILAPPSIISTASGSTTYSGIERPSVTDNKFAPGTYTLRFSQPAVAGVASITSRVFIVTSPTTITDSITTSIFQTTTAPPMPISTTTVTEYTSTATETTSTGPPPTLTVTGVVQSCAPASSSVASSISDAPSSTSSSASSPTAGLPVSVNGRCEGSAGQACIGSTFGNYCSAYGYCGTADICCQSSEGCQTGFGTCIAPSPVSSSALPSSTVKVSTEGTCDNVNSRSNGFVCTGSSYGDCCSHTAVPQQATAALAAKTSSAHALALQPQPQELRLCQLLCSRSRFMARAEAPQDKHVKAVAFVTAAQSTAIVEAPHSTAQAPASLHLAPALLR